MPTGIFKQSRRLITKTLNRTAWILAGYSLACYVAAVSIFALPMIVGIFLNLSKALDRPLHIVTGLSSAVSLATITTPFVVWLTIMPSSFIIAVSEMAGIKSRLWYIMTGAVIAILWFAFNFTGFNLTRFTIPNEFPTKSGSLGLTANLCGAGALAGYAYWMISVQQAERQNIGPFNFLKLIKAALFESASHNRP